MKYNPIEEFNNLPVDDFDGLSRSDMYQLLYGEFQDSVIRVADHESAHKEVPIVQMVDALLAEIDPESGLKLTAAGYLPPATVKRLYARQVLTDDLIEHGISKLMGESSSLVISTIRTIAEFSGLLRKRHGRLLVTKKGARFGTDATATSILLSTFGEKYNLAYADGFPSPDIAQVGYRYSLYLLKKYGDEPRAGKFYAERYFRAFPMLVTESDSDYRCYRVRTFDRFLSYFGFCAAGDLGGGDIEKTPLVDRYIQHNPDPKPPPIGSEQNGPDWEISLN